MTDKKTLDYYVSELRRVEESRQGNTEKEVKKIYKELLKDLNGFLGNEYAAYSDSDGILSVAILQEKARYAKFLQEVDEHLNGITPKVSKTIKATVQDTYNAVYTGMVDAVTKSIDNTELVKNLKGLSLRPEVMKRAVENPISGLTLPDTLEKHRKETLYAIKQQLNIGLMTGERYDTMAKQINKVISGDNGSGGLYGKACNIVRTETHRVQESGLMDCAKDVSEGLEDSGLIYTAVWRTMKDQKVRPQVRIHTSKGWKTKIAHTTANHQKMEGKIIKVGDKFEIEPGLFAECPGSSGTARNDCGCRCYLEYELMTVEEFAKASNNKLVKSSKPFSSTNNKLAESNTKFVPARTVIEAEDYAKKFITDGYSPIFKNQAVYKGLSLEHANEINKTLHELFLTYDMPKLNGIKAISPTSLQGKKVFKSGVDAIAAYNPVEKGIFINKNILKDAETLEKYNKKAREAFKLVTENIDSLSDNQKELASIYKNVGKSLVGDNSLKDYITHELGHHIQWQVLDSETNNLIGKNMSKFAPKISGYANTSKSEYIAESFVAYNKGKKDILDPNFVNFIDKKNFRSKTIVLKSDNQNITNDIVFTTKENDVIISTSKQLGKKLGKHTTDFKLNPALKEDREKVLDIIQDILSNYDEIAEGDWRGQEGVVNFYIKGNDVVVVSNGEFVTIMKDGVNNARVKRARAQNKGN